MVGQEFLEARLASMHVPFERALLAGSGGSNAPQKNLQNSLKLESGSYNYMYWPPEN